ncbi:uncharacterized protein [Antedon mediterranea]|uniref:uncharacterized protein n=1 Tax=Antedon mediterranea TaxID=105859 RepID=UPI003AF4BB30
MMFRGIVNISRLGFRTVRIGQPMLEGGGGICLSPALPFGSSPAGLSRSCRQPRMSLASARKLCTKSEKDVDKVKENEVAADGKNPILEGFHLRATRPNKVDRWILVFMGRYKSDQDIPDFVSDTIINSTKNKFRIIVNIGMGVFALLGGVVMIYIGRKRMQAGESISGMNIERHKAFYDKQKTSENR